MKMKIYEKMMEDPIIAEYVEGRIKFYEYPATGDVNGAYIIIDPLDVPKPGTFADNSWLTEDFLFQIEVWSKSPTVTKTVSKKIQQIMWDLGFGQKGGIDEWDKDFNIYRDARRYRGKSYVQDM